MSGFANLMKMSAAHTQSSAKEAAELLAIREAKQRKLREEQDARDRQAREQAKARTLREIESKRKEEADRIRKEEMTIKREQERDRVEKDAARAFLAPPKPSARSGASKGSSSTRTSSPRENNASSGAVPLTREEKRALSNPLFRDSASKALRAVAHKRLNGRLPGGASSRPSPKVSASNPQSGSAKQRIRETFQTLIPLNQQKKDMRSIDEIARDLERGRRPGTEPMEQVEFTGVEATHFNDWFGKSKKEREKEQAIERERLRHEKELAALTPKPVPVNNKTSSMKGASTSSSGSSTAASYHSASTSAARSSKNPPPMSSAKRSLPDKQAVRRGQSPVTSKGPTIPTRGIKRAPSPDGYSQRRPEKRSRGEVGYVPGAIAALFGRNLHQDRMRDESESEDEDDDAPRDYAALMREEAASARIAKKEDQQAEAEEKAREAEKRRKKAEKMAAGRA